jgi:hypothetical protein
VEDAGGEGRRYELVVEVLSMPWSGLGFIAKHEEWVMEPPEGTSFQEVQEVAEQFRALGASARIVQVA